jgi:Spy/CpxP family protein refolding chaperone
MRFRTTIMATAMLAAGVALAEAPSGPSQGQRQQTIERLTTELNLNADQKAKVEKVLEQQHVKMQSLHDQARSSGQHASRQEMHKQFQAMDQEMEQQLKPILTDEQMQKFKAMQAQRHEHPPGTEQGARPSGPG